MKIFKKILSKYSRVLLLLLIIAVLAVLKPEAFWNWSNITTVVFQQAPFTMLMSFGMTLAIITKGIDKSMGSVLVLSNVIAATLEKNNQILLGVMVALAIGIVCGVCNGLLITKAGIPPFVATYGIDFIALGLAYVYTGGVSIYGFSDSFYQALGEMRGQLEHDEKELRALTDRVMEKLEQMTDEDFDQLVLYPDI